MPRSQRGPEQTWELVCKVGGDPPETGVAVYVLSGPTGTSSWVVGIALKDAEWRNFIERHELGAERPGHCAA